VAAWEESKRLGKRVEELKKRLAGKQVCAPAMRGGVVGGRASSIVGVPVDQAQHTHTHTHTCTQEEVTAARADADKRGAQVCWRTDCLLLSSLPAKESFFTPVTCTPPCASGLCVCFSGGLPQAELVLFYKFHSIYPFSTIYLITDMPALQVASLQAELDRQSGAIRELQVRGD